MACCCNCDNLRTDAGQDLGAAIFYNPRWQTSFPTKSHQVWKRVFMAKSLPCPPPSATQPDKPVLFSPPTFIYKYYPVLVQHSTNTVLETHGTAHGIFRTGFRSHATAGDHSSSKLRTAWSSSELVRMTVPRLRKALWRETSYWQPSVGVQVVSWVLFHF